MLGESSQFREEIISMETNEYSLLVLEMTYFLLRRAPDATEMSSRNSSLLSFGLEFLQRIESGYRTASSGRALIPELRALSLYNFADQVLCSGNGMDKWISLEKEDVMSNAIATLQALMEGRPLRELDEEAVQQTISLFQRMQKSVLPSIKLSETDSSWETSKELTLPGELTMVH